MDGGVIRTVALTVASISAAGPHPSAGQAPWLVSVPAKPVTMQCAGECPSRTDLGEGLARVLHVVVYGSSASITEWAAIGTPGLHVSAWP